MVLGPIRRVAARLLYCATCDKNFTIWSPTPNGVLKCGVCSGLFEEPVS